MTPVSTRLRHTSHPRARSRWTALVVLALAASPARSHAAPAAADSLALPPPAVRRWQTGVLRPDRFTHSSLALAIGVGVGMLRRDSAAGAGVALSLGLAKELTDDHFDRGDLAADAIGAGLAACVVRALTR